MGSSLLGDNIHGQLRPILTISRANFRDLNKGAEIKALDLCDIVADHGQRVRLDLDGQFRKERSVLNQMAHAFQLLVGIHGQVDAEGTRANRLIKAGQRIVGDEDNATVEGEGIGEIRTLDLRLPGDRPLGVAVKRSLQQIDRSRIREDAVAVIKQHDAVLVLEQGAIQSVGCGVALHDHIDLRGGQVDRRGVVRRQEAVVAENLSNGESLTDTTFTGDNGRRSLALRDHLGESLDKGEPISDREGEALGLLLLDSRAKARQMQLQQTLSPLDGLGLGHHDTIAHGDILALGAIKGDGGRNRVSH